MSPPHIDEDSADFMVGTLEALAKEATTPSEAAQLRALAHLARTSSKTERRLGAVERAVARLEGLEGRNTDHDKRIATIELFIKERRAEVRGGWWVACKVAAVLTAAGSGVFALVQHFTSKP